MNIYDFQANDINGNLISLDKYKGYVLMVVNVASKCGNTKQYSQLEELYKKYKDQKFMILGFPCNQFFMQEPGNESEILTFCQTKYNIDFDMFAKIKVNGPEAHPLYTYLKQTLPWTNRAKNVKWNFEKFLIDRNGVPRYRVENKTNPINIEDKIIELLNEN